MSRPPTHGMTGTRTYISWASMKSRCLYTSSGNYDRYGAKGVTFCKRWKLFESFFDDMGIRPEGMTLERIDNKKPYEPDNCTWATPKEQALNRKSTKMITFRGETMCIADWCRRMGIMPNALRERLKKWPFDKAMLQKPQKNSRRKECPKF